LLALHHTNKENSKRFICFRAVNQAELERLCEEREVMSRKLVGLESDLKMQQQVRKTNVVLEESFLEERPLTPNVQKKHFLETIYFSSSLL